MPEVDGVIPADGIDARADVHDAHPAILAPTHVTTIATTSVRSLAPTSVRTIAPTLSVQALRVCASTENPISVDTWAARIVRAARTSSRCSAPARNSSEITPLHPEGVSNGATMAPLSAAVPLTTQVVRVRNASAIAFVASADTLGSCAIISAG